MVSARLQLEKDYKTAMQKQEQKIDLANKMYELVSRHIERLDSQVMTNSNLNKADWIKKAPQRKRLDNHTNGIRKR
jgi:translation elongation factor EF-G